ncbi:UDP-2,4-diacetamido-2,4,6-trideoxy-beta-L-altropyranose hydrolase [Methylotuvimicrobium alcaliphilum]|uniref:Polysaccharide biosynthesis protein n=1 Tax=Methylotuvimicrobium alcaliphilum (strain DSM 19304 / NCIMB 14124 / VKM B-2133 / 20Z) TaxID=1091494 RepID=G4T1K6_META2|nr:UDP-2,4-diacetamido-2,4,6-trideoxy-beta-L-altropyranose hydrolase [Methylotuvimicrobium alcaliphilum]CCE22428.1 putative polysaccharide biosynthesis protein [Methylotuvimicrobium alcaliphilum 20Z]
MNIVFRADASVRIGIGHIMRCLTLADALAIEGHDCTFVTRNHSGHLADLIQRRGHRVALMEPPAKNGSNETGDSEYAEWLGASWQADAEETIELLQDSKADWLIVDHYAIDHRWHKVLRPAAEKILVVDDLANRALDCEVVLNQNYGCRENDYRKRVRPDCLLLLGPRYALLRPEFSQLRPQAIEKRKTFQGIRRILVSMGGTDADNATSLVLQTLAGVDWPKPPEIDVVLNSRAPHLQSVIESARLHPLAVSVAVDVNDMAERMLRADLAFGAGGVTTWERCCLGLPSLVIMTANNQNFTIQTLHEFGVIFSLGPKNDFIRDIFMDDIEALTGSDKWQEMSRRSFAMTDGAGCLEVSHAMINISGQAAR